MTRRACIKTRITRARRRTSSPSWSVALAAAAGPTSRVHTPGPRAARSRRVPPGPPSHDGGPGGILKASGALTPLALTMFPALQNLSVIPLDSLVTAVTLWSESTTLIGRSRQIRAELFRARRRWPVRRDLRFAAGANDDEMHPTPPANWG